MGSVYKIVKPQIPSGQVYLFTTAHGVEYEVRFARKKENILHVVIAFGLLNEEYEDDEYGLTNKGDVFKVMRTVVEIIRVYHEKHLNTQIFEFTGLFKDNELSEQSQRTKLYLRYLPKLFDFQKWNLSIEGNKIVISKLSKKKRN